MRFEKRLIIIAMLGGVAISGCSLSVGGGSSVGPDELEQQVSTSLEEQVGTAPKSVECPNELEAEAGATTRCTLTTPDGTQLGVTVTVSEVDGSDVSLDIQVDEAGT